MVQWPDLAAFFTVFVVAVAWRVPVALRPALGISDEAIGAATVMQILRHDPWPVFLPGGYVGPLQEYLAAPLVAWFGAWTFLLRLPAIVLLGLGMGLVYLGLRRFLPRWRALFVALAASAANSTMLVYTAYAVPDYGAAIFLLFLLFWLALRVDEKRTSGRWLTFGLVAGLALYVFQIIAVPLLAILLWLALRSEAADRLSRRAAAWLPLCALPGVLLLPMMYRRLVHAPAGTPEKALAVVGVLALLVAAMVLILMIRPRPRQWMAVIVMLLPMVLIPRAAKMYDAKVVAPVRAAQGLYGREMGYAWWPWPQWPYRATLLLERVGPRWLVGRYDRIDNRTDPPTRPGIGAVASAALLTAVLVVTVIVTARRHGWKLLRDPLWLYLLPLYLFLAVLTPSSRLFGEYSYRYLVPLGPCLALGVTVLLPAIWNGSRSAIAATMLLVWMGYCGSDARDHLPSRTLPPAAVALRAYPVDGALVGSEWTDACVLEWYTGGKIVVGSLDPKRRGHYPDRVAFDQLTTVARVNVSEEQWAAFWGDRATALAPVGPDTAGVTRYRQAR